MKRQTGYFCLLTASALTASASTDALAREFKELRGEKRGIAVAANELGALARGAHINSWESHAIALEKLQDLVNRSGIRLARIQSQAGDSAPVSEIRQHLAAVAEQVTRLQHSLNENRLVTRTPSYYAAAMKLVQTAERSQVVSEKVIASALTRGVSSQTAD